MKNTYGVGTIRLNFSWFNIVCSCQVLLSIYQSNRIFGDCCNAMKKKISFRDNYHNHHLFWCVFFWQYANEVIDLYPCMNQFLCQFVVIHYAIFLYWYTHKRYIYILLMDVSESSYLWRPYFFIFASYKHCSDTH